MADILIVTDRPEDLWGFKNGLETGGHRVVLANTGPGPSQADPGVVIVDAVKDLTRGRDACRSVRAASPRAPLLALVSAEMIDALPLFRDVPADALDDLAGRVSLRPFSSGQPVVRQGDRSTAFWVVRQGTLEVLEENRDTNETRIIRTLSRGESFGELGLLQGTARTATVRSVGESELFEVDKPVAWQAWVPFGPLAGSSSLSWIALSTLLLSVPE